MGNFFFSLKSHFLCGVSTCQADWCILIVDRLNFSFLITAVFSVLSLGFFFNICVATEITGTHEYPSSYTLSIITIMQRGNDPSLFLPKGKLKE